MNLEVSADAFSPEKSENGQFEQVAQSECVSPTDSNTVKGDMDCDQTSIVVKKSLIKLPKAKKTVCSKRSFADDSAENRNDDKHEKSSIVTINLSDIESALGLGNKTLHQLDAKSLDKILLERLQKQNVGVSKGLPASPNAVQYKPPEKRACSESESLDSISSESVHSSRSQGEGCTRLKSPATVSQPISPMPADSQTGDDGTMVVDQARSPQGASSCDATVEANAANKNINHELCNGLKQSALDKAAALEPLINGLHDEDDYMPLCCCKVTITIGLTKVTMCQGVDSCGDKVLLCGEKVVSDSVLMRSSVTIPFMALCSIHRQAMTNHECCPGCGHFCTEGKFFTCKKDRRHYFHYQCRTLRNNVNYCPHCGDTSDQIAVMRRAGATLPDKLTVSTTLPSNSGQQHSMRREAAGGALLKITSQLWANRRKEQAAAQSSGNTKLQRRSSNSAIRHNGSQQRPFVVDTDSNASQDSGSQQHHAARTVNVLARVDRPRAKMSTWRPIRRSQSVETTPASSATGASVCTVDGKTLSTDSMPLGLGREQLECAILVLNSDKPKKLRVGGKNLYTACRTGDLEKFLLLLIEGADVNFRAEDDQGQTPLHAAATNGNTAIVHMLLQAGCMTNVVDGDLKTPLMCAAEANNVAVMQQLIKSGAMIEAQASDGKTCVHLAARDGNVDVLRAVFEHGKVNVNAKDDGGWTPLVWAAEFNHLAAVKFLLSAGADPNITDIEGNTGLHWAAYGGNVDIAEMLLNAGCNVEAANSLGDRSLHIAARRDHYDCVMLFLARGADSEARNAQNCNALACVADRNSGVWLALRVNQQLRNVTKRFGPPETLVHKDLSLGRDPSAVTVVNAADRAEYPSDFVYITDYVETTPLNINRCINSLRSCRCMSITNCAFNCSCNSNALCWYDQDGRLKRGFNYHEPPLIYECNSLCRCWKTCHNRVVQQGMTCRLQVFRTANRGWGARTLLDIPQGTFVCEYFGELISDAEADRREDDSYLFDLDNRDTDTYCIDARYYGNVSRFINHLCEPNVVPVKVFNHHQDIRFPRICFFASRDVKAGEELGFDYGEKFWIIKYKEFTCCCGSSRCRFSAQTIQATLREYHARQDDSATYA